MRSFWSRLSIILIVVGTCVVMLLPTIRWAGMSGRELAENEEEAEKLRESIINLGLDLQGGMHLVLEIREEEFRRNILVAAERRAERVLSDNSVSVLGSSIEDGAVEMVVPAAAASSPFDEWTNRMDFLLEPTAAPDPEDPQRLVLNYPLDEDRFQIELHGAAERALEIIRNRVDAFGVSEPVIQMVGSKRIVVELPGATDPNRARRLIGRTAQLKFHVVEDEDGLVDYLSRLDEAVGGALGPLYNGIYNGDDLVAVRIDPRNADDFAAILRTPQAVSLLPEGRIVALSIPDVDREGVAYIPVYLLEAEPRMTGENLEMARATFDNRNRPAVSFEFGSEGAAQFGDLTAELARDHTRLAIVLDGIVQSAPTVQSQIRRSGQITGSFTLEEARDLAVVLKAGALPAPVRILEDRTVGPSLGRDSIRKGLYASIIGLIIVSLIMVGRYKVGGIITVFILLLNMIILLGVLAMFRPALTLPGIAGIVLTIGMAVDANVLIFERIREELAVGKAFRPAVEAGFGRAFTTILDANVTTLITAYVLYYFGTGPVAGFAVTLSVGIIASMFTAVYVMRFIFDLILSKTSIREFPI